MSEPIRLPGVEVDPPPVTPYRYGLLSAASVQPDADRRWEIAGVVYIADACEAGGGVWLDPCFVQPLPDPTSESAFTVGINRAAVTDAPIIATLTARNAGYGTNPVEVTVDGVTKTLATISATQSWPVTAGTTVNIHAGLAGNGQYPFAYDETEFAVPAGAGGASDTLTAQVSVPPVYPTKTIPMGMTVVSGEPFIVYEGVSCGVGMTDPEAISRAETRLLLHEQFHVEQEFTNRELRGVSVVKPNGDTALPLTRAIGLLEQEIAARYGGLGVLHAPRNLAPLIDHLSVSTKDGERITSTLDNSWAFGAGYSSSGPAGQAAADGTAWLYATGPVVVRRSEVTTRTDFSTSRNIRMGLAERSYVITADCLRLAVLATLPGSP